MKAVSRSGRKIKPKKFADEESGGLYDMYENGPIPFTGGIPTEAPSSSAVSPITIGNSNDPSAFKAPKSQV